MKEMINFSNYSYLTLTDFVKIASREIAASVKADELPKHLPQYAWAASCPQNNTSDISIPNIYNDCECWFGLKCIPNPFDNTGVIVIIDYYGGGCVQCFGINDLDSIEDIMSNLWVCIGRAQSANGYGSTKPHEYILIEKIEVE